MLLVEQYIDYCHGKTPKRDVRRDRSVLQQERVPQRVTTEYPSAPMSTKGNTTKKEPLRYTGERKLLGIATMHKSKRWYLYLKTTNKRQLILPG